MIDISFFADRLATILNDAIEAEIEAGNTILDTGRVTYRFLIHMDGGEYKDYDYIDGQGNISPEPTNKIIRYINCEFDTIGSQIDGVLSVEMSFNSRLEVLIPLINAGKGKKRLELVNTIRQVLDSAFSLNVAGTYADENNTYNYGAIYQLAETSSREKRGEIGDSEILTAFLSFFLVQNGVNSAEYELYIDGQRVAFTRLGFARGVTNESNVPSDSSNGAGENIPSSTVFSLNFDMPTRTNGIDDILADFLFNGNKVARLVEVINPFNPIDESTNSKIPFKYLMIFDEVTNNAEMTKFASTTARLIQASDAVKKLKKSAYAQENWGAD